MFKRVLGAAALAAAAGFVAASSAQAGVVLDTSLASPGVYFGSGNFNTHFAVDTEDGIEIGLKSKIRSDATDSVHPNGADVYDIPLGDVFNFDYSFNPSVGGAQADTTGFTQLIHLTDAFGLNVSFNPAATALGNSTNAGAPGGFQNSEKISFGFLDPTYNANQNDTFHITYTVSNAAGAPVLSVENVVNVGAGAVPEPAAWALMILGLGGAGAMLRRRRQAVAA